MRLISLTLVAIGLVWGQGQPVFQAGKPLYVVTHVDIAPGPAGLGEPIKMLQDYAADTRKDAGCTRVEIYQQDRRNHFTVVEVWQTREAFEAHTAAEHTKRFREKINSSLGSPFGERLHSLLQ
jgi:quinol monooxygenase YgiN